MAPTHAPKQIRGWVRSLELPFKVRIHWLPVNASWLDQVEIVFSPLERKVFTPTHFTDLHELESEEIPFAPHPIEPFHEINVILAQKIPCKFRDRTMLASVGGEISGEKLKSMPF